MDDLYFEIRGGGNFIRIDFLDELDYSSNTTLDYNWLRVKISAKAGNFSGNLKAEIYSSALFSFYKGFSKLYDNLNGKAVFEDLEDHLRLIVIGDGIGHFNVEVTAVDYSCKDMMIKYSINFDQTQLPEMINQLDKIIKKYSAV